MLCVLRNAIKRRHTGVRIRRVEVPREDYIQHNRNRDGENSERPHYQAVALGDADDRVQGRSDEQAQKEPSEMGYKNIRSYKKVHCEHGYVAGRCVGHLPKLSTSARQEDRKSGEMCVD